MIFSSITFTLTYTPIANILYIFHTCFLLPSKTLRRLCRWIE
jgi:hypothetical protein